MKLFKILKRAAGLYFRKPLVFYIALPNTQVPNLNVPKEISFVSIDNINEYLKIIAKFKIPFSPFSEQRFENGAIFSFLHNNNEYLVYGWAISDCSAFTIGYTKTTLSIDESSYILFDFYTNDNHRLKGYYNFILYKYRKLLRSNNILIYTAPTNIGSHKGIIKSGFLAVGQYKKINMHNFYDY